MILAHQVLQARDLSDKDKGVKVNWTIAKAGSVRNMSALVGSAAYGFL